jgi:non-specific serine/threonine protein kinase
MSDPIPEPEQAEQTPTPGASASIEAMLHQVTARRETLPSGFRLGDCVLQEVLERDGYTALYSVTNAEGGDPQVLEEYLPSALVVRGEDGSLLLRDAQHALAYRAGLEAFVRESEQLARPVHPALLRVGARWQALGTAYRLTPRSDARPLAKVREAMSSPPGDPWLRALLDPLIDALKRLHEAGIVHGDVRPGRVLVRPDGMPMLGGFGSARAAISQQAPWLASWPEPEYVPIELFDAQRGLTRGPWSDLYSLAAVSYFCLTGRAPLAAQLRAEGLALPSLSSVLGGMPAIVIGHEPHRDALLIALDRAMSVEPRDRQQSMEQFRQELDSPPWMSLGTLVQEHEPPPKTIEIPRVDPTAAPPPPFARPAAGLGARHQAHIDPEFTDQDLRAETDSGTRMEPQLDVAGMRRAHEEWLEGGDPSAHTPARSGAKRRSKLGWAIAAGVVTAAALGYVAVGGAPGLSAQLQRAGDRVSALGDKLKRSLVRPEPRASREEPLTVPQDSREGVDLPATSQATTPVPAPIPTPPPATAIAPTPAPQAPATVAVPAPAPVVRQEGDVLLSSPLPPIGRQAPPGAPPAPAPATEPAARVAPAPAPAPEPAPEPSRKSATGVAPRSAPQEARPAPAELPSEPISPREACGARSNFALYRCMTQQCQRDRFYSHPQCVRLRQTDEVS